MYSYMNEGVGVGKMGIRSLRIRINTNQKIKENE